MHWGVSILAAGLLVATAGADVAWADASADAGDMVYEQTCDASAVVFTVGGLLLVADDRTDVLHTYLPAGGAPIARHDLYELTTTPRRARRNYSAFEGAARLGDSIYFITSHAREGRGKNRPSRRRLIALKSKQIATSEMIEPRGVAYTSLRADLSAAPEMRSVALGSAIMEIHRQLAHLAPDKKGLNIEGLAAGKDGESLLVGLRNPRRQERALIVPLLNPDRMVLGFADAKFGQPIKLDLGGLGIASIALDPDRGVYYIIAAHHDAPGDTRLYRWSGHQEEAPALLPVAPPADYAAQALAVSADGERLIVLSDDGDARIPVESAEQCTRAPDEAGTCACAELTDPKLRRFRGRWLAVPPPPPSAPSAPALSATP